MNLMKVSGLESGYGRARVLRDFGFELAAGEVLCLLGRNGAGKTTALKTLMGTVRASAGEVLLAGEDLSRLPAEEVPRRGVGYVPQGRRLFGELTVAENLDIGLQTRKTGPEVRAQALALFPVLSDRLDQRAGTLSGGEQTMLAVARAMCVAPKVMLLDEPTEGLMPAAIAKIREAVIALRDSGVGILLVEQRVEAVLPVADRVAFMDHGQIRATVEIDEVRKDPALLHRYVGLSDAPASQDG